MAFKMKRSSGTPILRQSMEDGSMGEARMDGSIVIDPSIKKNSSLYKRIVKHEKAHIDQIRSGRASYGDNYVQWEGKLYIRNNGYIYGPEGKLPEGHPNHPWEAEAIAAEDK